MEATGIRIFVVISDLHCGSTTGLLPPGCVLSEGNVPSLNPLQQWIWERWEQFWREVDEYVGREPWALVVNGDATEGIHHGTREIVSNEPGDHYAIAERCLAPLADKADKVFFVRGTECHTHNYETGLAKMLGAPLDYGARAPDQLLIDVDGCLVSVMHHITPTTRKALEGSGPGIALAEEIVQTASVGHKPPKVILRAHRHVYHCQSDGFTLAVVSPAWQLKTRHAMKVVPASRSVVGGYLLDWRYSRPGEIPIVVPSLSALPQREAVVV